MSLLGLHTTIFSSAYSIYRYQIGESPYSFRNHLLTNEAYLEQQTQATHDLLADSFYSTFLPGRVTGLECSTGTGLSINVNSGEFLLEGVHSFAGSTAAATANQAALSGKLYLKSDGSFATTEPTDLPSFCIARYTSGASSVTQVVTNPILALPYAHHTSHEYGGDGQVYGRGWDTPRVDHLKGLLEHPQNVRLLDAGVMRGDVYEINLGSGLGVQMVGGGRANVYSEPSETSTIQVQEDGADRGTFSKLNFTTDMGTEINGSVINVYSEGGSGGAPNAHAASHQNGGSDEISVVGLSGLLADGQTPLSHAASHQDGGSDEISIAGLTGVAVLGQKTNAYEDGTFQGAFREINFTTNMGTEVVNAERISVYSEGGSGGAPDAHAASHQYNGSDSVNANNLSGMLLGPQRVNVYVGDTHAGVFSELHFLDDRGIRLYTEPTNPNRVNVYTGASASNVTIVDASALFTATNVESALDELATSVTSHDLLSNAHDDTTTASPVAGDIIHGVSDGYVTTWQRLGIGSSGQVFTVVNGNTAWSDGSTASNVYWDARFELPGEVIVANHVTLPEIPPSNLTLIDAYAWAGTWPYGGNALFQILNDTVPLFTSPLSIPAGNNFATTSNFAVGSVNKNAILKLNVSNAGGTVYAGDVKIRLTGVVT